MSAIGLIETKGLVYAIECADLMLKTAQVSLLGKTCVGGGLVTIIVTGDVGAVSAAVKAGVSAVCNMEPRALISHHVIPRPHVDVLSGYVSNDGVKTAENKIKKFEKESVFEKENFSEKANETKKVIAQSKDKLKAENTEKSIPQTRVQLKNYKKNDVDNIVKNFGIDEALSVLEKMTLVKLRKLAPEYKDLQINGYVSKSNKQTIIEGLRVYYLSE